jgi:hypothetical protein
MSKFGTQESGGVVAEIWLRGVDLNHRPLGYEILKKRIFSELAGVVAYFREWKIAAKSIEELIFWVGFGLASLVSMGSTTPNNLSGSRWPP